MNNFIRRSMVLLLLITITACAGRAGKGLPVNHDLGTLTGQSGNSVKVTLDAPVWLWDDKIRYRLLYDDASAVRYYHLDRWEAPLPALLERQLRFIESRSIMLRVVLEQFEQRFKTPDNAQALIELSVSAYCGEGGRLLGARQFSRSQQTASADAAGAISGFTALIHLFRADIQDWLVNLPDSEHCSQQTP